jgi:hypothetical protein
MDITGIAYAWEDSGLGLLVSFIDDSDKCLGS